MKTKFRNIFRDERLNCVAYDLGGEPLDGSGFGDERPDEGFTGAVLPPSTFLPDRPKGSHSSQ